ncbi:dephospho-CoA kinase [Paenibacillus thermoaerophilus]|uniref:Dephospho-CoA kinase n=1 Tax=Paenibacillus thermoaerophilus TaxID=1215385 RepID=A0ABW2UZ10_9BACL|nr:dephospho-CoA kinase [Paenibacillus thermoaerophilus]TMV15976.1 dephospho-CoA kinase [Paenibacillus thermoaerophilus]
MRIGLTGGIACGKSTVAAMLAARGAAIIDADRVAREVVEPGKPALAAVAAEFGPGVLDENGGLNRKALGAIVFADAKKRRKLESILHPAIRERMDKLAEEAEARDPDAIVIADIPLLYESGLQDRYERVLVVYVPPEIQLRRLMERDKLSEAEARSRLAAQWPIDRKRELADDVIDNSGTLEETERQLDAWWRKLVARS